MPLYHYTVTVFAAQRTEPNRVRGTAEVSGTVTADSFTDAVEAVLRQSLHELLAGRPQFDDLGPDRVHFVDPTTCGGPYQIRRLVIERFDA